MTCHSFNDCREQAPYWPAHGAHPNQTRRITMVQVDVFWAYGWGASLAVACGHQLARKSKPLETAFWAKTCLFLALFWAPTGLLLLIRHPSWETMQAAASFTDLSVWLGLGFGITNITP